MHPAVERYLHCCLEAASLAPKDEREVREELLTGLEFLERDAQSLNTDEVYTMLEENFGPAVEIGRSIASAKGRFRTYLKKEWRKGIYSLPIALLLFFVVRAFVAETFVVQNQSMEPAIPHGERVIVNKLAYTFGEPHVGELVAYRDSTGRTLLAKITADGDVSVEVEKLAGDFQASVERSALIGRVWLVTH